MRRLLLSIVFVLALAAVASAQTVVLDIDFARMDFGGRVIDFEQVDDDGDPSTVAWLLHLTDSSTKARMIKLVVQRADGSLCQEAAFDPGVQFAPFASAPVVTMVDGRSMVKVFTANPFASVSRSIVRSLDRVACREP